jgi:DNA repair exonuclease SbcCD ATPase subunit
MRIKELSIKNFGPIKSFEVAPTGNLIGVVGNNGQGKSHVLKGLRFLFTNHLSEVNASFIHLDEKAAELEVVFDANGQEGRIQKRILRSGTRNSFKWEGKEYTKAEPITRVLEDIFQTKRESLMEVGFRSQGSMDGILFGMDSVREQLFSNLLSADFTKARDILQTKSNVLKAQFSDLTAVLEEEKSRLRELELAVRQCEEELKRLPAESLNTYRELKQKLEVFNSISSLKQSISNFSEQLEETEVQLKDLRDYDAWEQKNREWEDTRQDWYKKEERLRALEKLSQWQQKATELAQKRDKLTQDLEAADKELETLPDTDIASFSKSVNLLRTRLENARAYQKAAEDLPTLHQRVEAARKDCEAASATLNETNQHLEKISADCRTLARLLDVRQEIANNTNDTSEKPTCGKCGLILDRDALLLLSEEAIAKIQEQHTQLCRQEREVTELKTKHQEAVRRTDREFQILRKLHAEKEAVFDELADYREVSIAETEAEFEKLSKELTSYQELMEKKARVRERRSYLNTQMEDTKEQLDQQTDAIRRATVDLTELSQIETLRTECASLKETVQAMGQKQEADRAGWEAYKKSQSTKAVLERQLSKARTELAALIEQAGTNMTAAQQRELHTSLEKYEDIVQQEKTLRELLSERTRTMEQSRTRVGKLQAQMKGDSELRMLVNKLEQTRNLLSRSGIPGIYMRERFLQIAELTQHYLQQLRTNFVVLPEDNSLRFNFMQPEKYGDTELSMEKLSGGQRIRLSVAFLMAAGQLLTPNFQFLTLDEPSTHLDEEGKDSLVSLFERLSVQLDQSDHQVWVVDHEPMFMRAFNEVYQL